MANAKKRPVITLTTDFGTADHYVGTMKCVIAGICPDALVIDITHEIAASDLISAAYAVSQPPPFSPAGTIHVVVVDPGVGTARRAIAVRQENQTYIAPDNGVLSLILSSKAKSTARELKNDRLQLPSLSATFHGRDIFAPAAAQLAAESIQWEAVGPEIHDCVVLAELKSALEHDGRWRGIALNVDRFGNVITNLPATLAALDSKPFTLQTNAYPIRRFCKTFAESGNSDPFVYAGSSGYFEIAINQGNAANVLGIVTGDPVTLELNA
jgi:hypothetical protein